MIIQRVKREDRLFWVLILATGGVAGLVGLLIAGAAPEPPPRKNVVKPGSPERQTTSSRSNFNRHAQARRQQVFTEVQGDEAFTRLGEPDPGDWLWHFQEPGQTLEEYGHGLVNRKSLQRRVLHLQPYADLSKDQRRVIKPLRQFLTLFFDSEVRVLPVIKPRRSWFQKGRQQYNADLVVQHLARQVPHDSLGLFGLMGSDLYGLDLNFVFGVALLQERAGVYSIHRFASPPGLRLLRTFKLAAHEIGHIFGLKHCVFYKCLMNGTNSLTETDRSPVHLCPVCLAKLHHNLRFDPQERYQKLAAIYNTLGLRSEAVFITQLLESQAF